MKVSTAKDLDKNYINVRPPLVHHLLRNRLLRMNANRHFGTLRYPLIMYAILSTYVTHCSNNKYNWSEKLGRISNESHLDFPCIFHAFCMLRGLLVKSAKHMGYIIGLKSKFKYIRISRDANPIARYGRRDSLDTDGI